MTTDMTTNQRLCFENMGFLHLPGVIPADLVKRVSVAFDAAAKRQRAEVAAAISATGYFDIPNILDVDDCFVDLVDLPLMVPVLLGAIGPDIQLNHTHARIFPPGPTFTAPWHTDLSDVIGIDLAHSLHFFVKVHYYFHDLQPNEGCLAFMPGTHHLPPNYPRPKLDETASAVVKIVPKAGDAVLFNTHVMHMALDNSSPKTRKSLIYAYSHFWVKNYGNGVPTNIDRVATTPFRRQLFGIETPGVSYFDMRYDGAVVSDPHSSLRAASQRLIRWLYKTTSITMR